ncbi:MAG: signal peptidase I [Clostridia bacterium]|nr:signal peptidase I [Clostridia bacterium]NCC66577.1 signal peptidase I [Clostridia bacterium]
MKPMKAGADVSTEIKQTSKNRALGIIVNIILILAIVLGIFCSFTAFVSKKGSGVPSFFGIRPFAIQSDSMAPLFYKGDLIIDKTVKDPSKLKVGDVITFWTVINGERVLNSHRITEIADKSTYLYFTTKGDNNDIADTIGVHQSEIVGRYIGRVPGLGTVIDYLQTGTGFLLFIVIPVFLFFVYQLFSFFKTLFAYKAEKMRLQIQKEYDEKEKSANPATKPAGEEAAGKAEEIKTR